MVEPAVEVTDSPAEADVRAVYDGLIRHNERFLGQRDLRRLAVVARDDDRLLGGLIAETARGFLFVDMLWVAPPARGRGLGSRLLAAAEAEARARGCKAAWLDTYDFQARPFYERQGYAVFGELAGYANGHRRFFMAKSLPD